MPLTEFAAESGASMVEAGALAPADTFMVLDLSAIVPSTTNPRTVFNEHRLLELAESIKASGVHQPVLVRPLPASRLQETFEGRRKRDALPAYELIAGERRYRASKLAGATTIPAMIRQLTDAQVLEIQLVENLQRDDLHPMEEAEGYEKLCQATGITKEQLGEKIGKSRGYVYARLKLLELHQDARQAFYQDKIDASRALVIARIPDAKLQATALAEATATDWNGAPRHSFKSFTRWAQQNVMLRLDAARFKITDESLVPEAGSCKACPKRTGAQPDVFADVDSADVCIDPACYHAKEEANEAIVLAQAKAKGQRIITEREAKKLWQWEHGSIDGYVRLDRPDPRVGGSKMLKTVLGKQGPEPILLQNPHKQGELIEVLPRDKVNALLKNSGKITPHQARAERTVSAEEAKRNAVAKFEKTWRRRAIEAVHQAMADQSATAELSEDLGRVLARELMGGLRGDERQHVCELLGLGKVAQASAIEDYLRTATALQAEQAMFLLLMEQDLIHLVGYYSSDSGKPTQANRIEAVAAYYSVPLAPVKEALAAELKERAKPKAAEPAPKPAKAGGAKKSSAPPAAPPPHARKPSKEQVQREIADAFQALDAGAEGSDQAPDGAELDEGAAPAAPALKLGDLARVKAGSKGPNGKLLKTIGRVGRVVGLGDDGRVHLKHGERRHELVVVEPEHVEPYTADPLIGSQVRVLSVGIAPGQANFLWRQGIVRECRSDGWGIAFTGKNGAVGDFGVFGTDVLEVL